MSQPIETVYATAPCIDAEALLRTWQNTIVKLVGWERGNMLGKEPP